MIRNCMKEVANMFGPELGDKFNLRIVAYDKDYEHNPCYFSEEGLIETHRQAFVSIFSSVYHSPRNISYKLNVLGGVF